MGYKTVTKDLMELNKGQIKNWRLEVGSWRKLVVRWLGLGCWVVRWLGGWLGGWVVREGGVEENI